MPLPKKDHNPAYQSSQVGALTGQLKASLNSRELAVVPCCSLVSMNRWWICSNIPWFWTCQGC